MNLDFLAARLHGRRSRLAEGGRLEELCRLRGVPELASALYPGREFRSALELQHRLVEGLMQEVWDLAAQLSGTGARLLEWMALRFQVENLKALLRGYATHTPLPLVQKYLLSLPGALALPTPALTAAGSLAAFARRLPLGPVRESLEQGLAAYGAQAKPLFLEAACDRGYFRGLLTRAAQLREEHKPNIQALVFQEVDVFHLRLVSRGKFYYGLAPGLLLPLHVPGTGISRARFVAMLEKPDLPAAAQLAVGRVIDVPPGEPHATRESPSVAESARLEALAWERYLRLANATFRRSHIGLGTVVGYVGIRRVEVANLITLSEGLRAGLEAEALRARLVPRLAREAAYV